MRLVLTQPITTPVPSELVSYESRSASGEGSTKQAPTQAELRVPQNQIEHNQIIARLVEGGSIPSKAELVIASRKTAFNKALREFKRDQGQNMGARKVTRLSAAKPSKHVAQTSSKDDN